MPQKSCLFKELRANGCDTKEKLRAAYQIVTGTLRVNPEATFSFNDGRIYQG